MNQMCPDRWVDITGFRFTVGKSLAMIEGYLEGRLGWEEGSFTVVGLSFSDGETRLALDPPTDLLIGEIDELLQEADKR